MLLGPRPKTKNILIEQFCLVATHWGAAFPAKGKDNYCPSEKFINLTSLWEIFQKDKLMKNKMSHGNDLLGMNGKGQLNL